jgi:hypothetical protein
MDASGEVLRGRGDYMQETKYRDLVVLLILLDEVELRARELAEQYPELCPVGESISAAAGLCDLALTLEELES